MEFLNIHSSTYNSPAFVGAEPTDRATWLCLLFFCIGQENGGTIDNCGGWSDRKWQQLVRVTLEETGRTTELWEWLETEGGGRSLKVAFYPTDAEQKVIAARKSGRAGGLAKAGATGTRPSQPQAPAKQQPAQPGSERPTKGNGMEGNGREGNESAPRARDADARSELPTSLDTPPVREAWQRWLVHWSQTFNDSRPMPEQTAHIHLQKLAEFGAEQAPAAIDNAIAKRMRVPLLPFPDRNQGPNGAAMR